MKSLPFSKIRSFVLVLALVILSGGVGYQLGERKVSVRFTDKRPVVNTGAPGGTSVNFGVFWDVWGKLTRYYIEPQSIDVEKLVNGAITGMVAAVGDPYTSFFPPQENKQFKEDLGGAIEGIGAELGLRDGRVIIVTPLKGTPAEDAGVKPNDIILKVNDEETAGWTVDQAVNKIRGPKGTKVKLTLLSPLDASGPHDVSIVRNTITIPSVTSWIKPVREITEISSATEAAQLKTRSSDDRVAYIKLTRFGDNTNADWNKAVDAILAADKANKLGGMILDLRNNPGGYLDGAVYIASEFMKGGTVVSQVNSDGTRQNYPTDRKGRLTAMPVVVLVNGGSASASEIVAGALRDSKRAKLVGQTTFGKGTVQTPFDLSGGSSVHITTGKWLLPGGSSISQKGLTPDLTVALDVALSATADAQLAKAIELLLQ
ncbi:MAG: S41 family peptidase [Patescibacteria group bacterium]